MRLGIEVEFTGVTKKRVAEILSDYFGNEWDCEKFEFLGEDRLKYRVEDYNGQEWIVLEDRSISTDNGDFEYACELVTPVLEDYEDLFNILEVVKIFGGVVNDTCGVHIHIDKPRDYDLYRILKKFFSIQDSIVEKFEVPTSRLNKYCKKFPKEFIEGFLERFDETSYLDNMLDYSYNELGNFNDIEKNPLRYYLVNLDSIRKIGTLEFRMFNSSLDKEVLNKYINWVEDFLKSCNIKIL